MSSIASFYLLSKDDLDSLHPVIATLPKKDHPHGEHLVAIAVPFKEAIEKAAPYNSFWEYLHEHGRRPFKYRWSGYALLYVLLFLSEKGIALEKASLLDTGDANLSALNLFDQRLKAQYLEQLIPSNFPEEELEAWLINTREDLPIQALIDGIQILHQYLELVDESNVVLFHIG